MTRAGPRAPTRFVVELRSPAIGFHDVGELARRARAAAGGTAVSGGSARFVRAVSVPEDGSCLLIFEALDQDAVERTARRAFGAVARVAPAIALSGEPAPPGGPVA